VGPVVRALQEPGEVSRARVLSLWGRRLPAVLVIGAAKAGTSSLFYALKQHPGFAEPTRKEINYFDVQYERGTAWYRAHFPLRWGDGAISGEASPYYLYHPHAARRAAALVPHTKLIALLREPVDRAFSHYHHNRVRDREHLSFEEAVGREEERIGDGWRRMLADEQHDDQDVRTYSYLARGRYAEQLDRWMEHFPSRQLLVLRSEDLYVDPPATFARVTDFLGLPRHADIDFEHRNAGEYGDDDVSPELRARLAHLFAADGARLRTEYGADLTWP
jgi:hypothetical protein